MKHQLMMEPPTTRLPLDGPLCSHHDANPTDWDIDKPYPGTTAIDHLQQVLDQSMKLCGDCPLLSTCARYALEMSPGTVWLDVVIAGVPMVVKQVRGFSRLRRIQERALLEVTNGTDLSLVHHQLLQALLGDVELAGATRAPGARPVAVGAP